MILVVSGVLPPKEWEHKSTIQNKDGYTVASLLAFCGIVPMK